MMFLFYPIKKVLYFFISEGRLKRTFIQINFAFSRGEIYKYGKTNWNAALREMNDKIGVNQDQVI